MSSTFGLDAVEAIIELNRNLVRVWTSLRSEVQDQARAFGA